MALQLKGDVPATVGEYEKAQQLSDNLAPRVRLAAAKAQSGDKEAAARMLAELEELSQHRYVHAYSRTLLYLSLNNREEAIRWLEQGVANHEGGLILYIKVDPFLDPLRGDPRFEALVAKVFAPKNTVPEAAQDIAMNPKNFFAKQGFVKDTINTLNERVYIVYIYYEHDH
jgi:hypothetical protein